jgi:hypothetical protein
MIRSFIAAALALVVAAGVSLAGEVKGKFVKFDETKKTLVLDVEGKETELTLTDTSKVGKNVPKDLTKAFAKVKPGSMWLAVTEKQGDKEVIVELKPAPKKAK